MMVIKPPPRRYKQNLVSLSFAKWLVNCCALATCMPWTQLAMNATLHKKRPVAHWLVGEQRLRPPHDRHTTATRPPHDRHMVKRVKRAHTHAAAPEVSFNRIYTPVPGGVGRPFIRFTRFTMWRSCGGRVAVVWRSCGGRLAAVWWL